MKQFRITDSGSLASRRGQLFLAAVIVVVTLAAYLPVLDGNFIWDDSPLLLDNSTIKAPNGLRRIWFSTESPEYLPLTFTMHWVEWRMWNGRAAGFHVVNVLLHAASAVLLWRVLRRLNVPGAWLAGMLFAVHPVAAASAAWISERKNTLSMALCAASLLAFLRFDEKAEESGNRRLENWEIGNLKKREGEKNSETADFRGPDLPISHSPDFPISQLPIYLLSIILFLLALLAKTSVVMLPVVLLLCVWWRRGAIGRKDLLRSGPFFALSLALGLVTIWFQQKAIADAVVHPEGAASRVAGAGWVAWFYLYKVLLPAGLCALYPYWKVDGSRVLPFMPLLLLAAGAALLWARRKSWGRAPLFALGCFLIILLPVLGFLDMSFMRFSLVADHLQYAAMAGVIAFGAAILARAATATGGARLAGVAAAVVCVAVLGASTFRRAWIYADEGRLWRDNAAKNPTAWAALENLGNRQFQAGAYDKAIPLFDEAIRANPRLPEAYYNRAYAYLRSGRPDFAIRDCDEAIELRPDYAEAYNIRGVAYGRINRYDISFRNYDEAIKLNPKYAEAYNNRGNACVATGRFEQAIADYGEAIRWRPDFAEAYCNRGNARVATDRLAAVKDYTEAIRLKPDYAAPYRDRAAAWYYMKEYDKAAADVETLQKLGGEADPGFLKEPRSRQGTGEVAGPSARPGPQSDGRRRPRCRDGHASVWGRGQSTRSRLPPPRGYPARPGGGLQGARRVEFPRRLE